MSSSRNEGDATSTPSKSRVSFLRRGILAATERLRSRVSNSSPNERMRIDLLAAIWAPSSSLMVRDRPLGVTSIGPSPWGQNTYRRIPNGPNPDSSIGDDELDPERRSAPVGLPESLGHDEADLRLGVVDHVRADLGESLDELLPKRLGQLVPDEATELVDGELTLGGFPGLHHHRAEVDGVTPRATRWGRRRSGRRVGNRAATTFPHTGALVSVTSDCRSPARVGPPWVPAGS